MVRSISFPRVYQGFVYTRGSHETRLIERRGVFAWHSGKIKVNDCCVAAQLKKGENRSCDIMQVLVSSYWPTSKQANALCITILQPKSVEVKKNRAPKIMSCGTSK